MLHTFCFHHCVNNFCSGRNQICHAMSHSHSSRAPANCFSFVISSRPVVLFAINAGVWPRPSPSLWLLPKTSRYVRPLITRFSTPCSLLPLERLSSRGVFVLLRSSCLPLRFPVYPPTLTFTLSFFGVPRGRGRAWALSPYRTCL
jgi:hypothetical protein